MRNKLFVFPALAVIGVIAAFLIGGGLTSNTVYYLFPDEALAQQSNFLDGRVFRLGGRVVAGSVEATGETTFEVSDGGATVSVVTNRTPPQLFGDDVPVLLEGSWEGDTFRATQIIIRHDEQYVAPDGYEEAP